MAAAGSNNNELGNLSAAALEQLTAAAALASLNPLNQLTGSSGNAGGGQSSSTGGSPAASSSLNSGIFASSSNPFLSNLSASPFMSSPSGLPFMPSNFTAIAQLQALMGLQDAREIDESIVQFPIQTLIAVIVYEDLILNGLILGPYENTKTTSSSCQSKPSTTKSPSTKSGVSISTSEQSSSSKTTVSTTPTAGGGGKKLNALADKLASSEGVKQLKWTFPVKWHRLTCQHKESREYRWKNEYQNPKSDNLTITVAVKNFKGLTHDID
uniref:Uncharacterized protein n=1 Tax=Romanomermis culicivorax TaxID=13658 RepID=A0A915K9N2_ROMCU